MATNLYRKQYEKRRDSDFRREYRRWYHTELKLEALQHYGGTPPKCVCCGESRVEFLVLDHIEGNGKQDRKKTGGGAQFYQWLRKRKYPQGLGLQVLCFNCNMSKGLLGYCPHQLGRENVSSLES